MNKRLLLEAIAKTVRTLRPWGLVRRFQWVKPFLKPLFGQVKIERDGFHLAGQLDHWESLQKFSESSFEPETARVFRQVVGPGSVAMDIGAHLGYYSLLAARLVGEEGLVFAFEPDPLTRALLTENVRSNRFQNVTVVPLAVSDREGKRRLFLHEKDPSQNSLYLPASTRRSLFVECVSLDAFLKGRKVDVIKIDIEGGEWDALQGMKATLEANPEAVLFVELNPEALRRAGRSPEELIGSLKSAGFQTTVLDPQPGPGGSLISNLFCRRG